MNKSFEILLQHRKVLHHYLKETPLETLNAIPSGFRNNIFWNIAHSVVTQQLLTYGLSNATPLVPQTLIDQYRKGTVPKQDVTSEEVTEVHRWLFKTVERSAEDFQLGTFRHFRQYTTATKVVLNRIEDAIEFNNFHEGLHLGYIMALQKSVS